jgi:GxxExxY protein
VGAEKKTSDKVLYPELSYALQGAFYEVYNVLGPGFREETYQQALMQELRLRGIPFETEKYYDFGAARLQVERRVV